MTEYIEVYYFMKLYVKDGTRGEGRNFDAKKAKDELLAFIDKDEIVNSF